MEALVRSLAHASGWFILLLIVVAVIQNIVLIRLRQRLNRHNRRWRAVARDAQGMDLETILDQHVRERAELAALFEGSQGRLARIEAGLAATRGQMGLVRYDAFPEVGGEQSFSLAILNDAGDGAVMSSIIGREGGRVYCKGMLEGRSDRALTDEERRAIEAALGGNRAASR